MANRPRPPESTRIESVSGGRIYSVGYEGLTLDRLVEWLVQSRVMVLIDVRLNAVSRRPGFSKRALWECVGGCRGSIRARAVVGQPPENRDSFRQSDGDAGRATMRERLQNGSGIALHYLVDTAGSARVAVLCVERDRPSPTSTKAGFELVHVHGVAVRGRAMALEIHAFLDQVQSAQRIRAGQLFVDEGQALGDALGRALAPPPGAV